MRVLPGMHSGCGRRWGWCVALAACCCWMLLAVSTAPVAARPSGNPEAMATMRHIPQWHCLRYRRFDLVKRCRNYRGGRRH